VEGITAWMKLNSEAIYDTRPWRKCGEGPSMEAAAPLQAQGFNEGKGKGFGPEDIRFTTKGKTLYAIVLGWPETRQSLIKSLSANSGKVTSVSLLGHHDRLRFEQTDTGLRVQLPAQPASKEAVVLKVEGAIER
jgi:alpha-L-fucosidase